MLSFPFYQRDTVTVARELLGKRLVRVFRGIEYSGFINETEAYLGAKDPASHTFKGRRTARNAAMYLEGGHAYVYFVYGMHFCFNVVTRAKDQPEAVLVRSLKSELTVRTDGPARLCKALKITKAQNGLRLDSTSLFIDQGKKPKRIIVTPRIGVDYAGEAAQWPLRFLAEF